jgi:hypothetical protein
MHGAHKNSRAKHTLLGKPYKQTKTVREEVTATLRTFEIRLGDSFFV